MPRHVFMTGFPGFIAGQLMARLAAAEPETRYTFLVEERFKPRAEAQIRDLERQVPGFAKRARLALGDLTRPDLGLSEADLERLRKKVHNVWHLAAIYDLSVPQSFAYKVNVLGTANILDLCEQCQRFERLDYVSTCYVSGDRHGTVLESELDAGQGFKNHYESTKAWAEMEVRRRMHRVPTAIYRPGIVVGDSRTGVTAKFDGPYFLIKALLDLPSWLPMVNVGAGEAPVNIVPVDFVVDAMAVLSRMPEAIGLTFQLADPAPSSARDIVASAMRITGHGKLRGSLPAGLVDRLMRNKGIQSIVPIPREAIEYFNHEVFHDSKNTQRLLAASGVRCPNFLSYLPTAVEYLRAHPE